MKRYALPHLRWLEAEAIHILREAAAEFQHPVLLYSAGKDSSCLIHLARKAFWPGALPFPLLHVDTGYKFPEMNAHRDRVARECGAELIVHRSDQAGKMHPTVVGLQRCCGVLKTKALLDAMAEHGFDAAIGGARREEETSRAKERVYSLRDKNRQWDPKRQRPEPWSLFNPVLGPGESMRVFPLSNWTELDVWHYIHVEQIPVVPLYFAAEREVVRRAGLLLLATDATRLLPGETIETVVCRFRTLGCMPCTAAVVSKASTVPEIIEEMTLTHDSERSTRLIDHDVEASMELKKREGYF